MIEHAEAQLFSLAHKLRRRPIHEEADRRLHIRALEFKREVSGWRSRWPGHDHTARVIRELEELSASGAPAPCPT
jgi:hypothetical protein